MALSLALVPPAGATEYTHALEPGQRLNPGDILYSPGHAYRLVMQGDGNLVLYSGGTALWSSGTVGHPGANAVMQGDGNLVVYQSGTAIWSSGTAHHAGAILDMQDDGNLVIYSGGAAIWSTGTNQPSPPTPPAEPPAEAAPSPTEYTHALEPGQRLNPGDILYSPGHAYRLVMQGDGNLVLYSGGTALWSSGTVGHPGANAVMQGDGNLVVYQSGTAIWSSGTAHHGGAILDLQDDGNLVIYWNNGAIWSTGTNASGSGRPPGGHAATPGQRLPAGTILYSPNHRYRLVMQGDGNLVVYEGSRAKWSTRTPGHPGANAVMQGDGNLVVYWQGKAIWSSRTAHHAGAILDLQDDGNLVIYWNGHPLWSSKGEASRPSQGMAILRAAASQAGIPYCEPSGGIHGPTACGGKRAAFDCSGLAMFAVYQGTGGRVALPHGAGMDHVAGGVRVARKNLRPGDLVFFGLPYNGADFSHVGIYAGGGTMWDAPDWGETVRKDPLWRSGYDGAVRYWR